MLDHMSTFLSRSLAVLAVASGLAFSLAACNTVEGAGEDIEATGDAISDAAEDAKN